MTKSEIKKCLKSVEEMLFFPLQNKWNLTNEKLEEMKKDLEGRLAAMEVVEEFHKKTS